jgi:S-adenosylmethionine hydrolase
LGQEDQDEHFPMGGLFARVAAHLSKGGKLEMISRPFGLYKKQNFPKAYFQNGMLMAQVIHIDVFDNIVLNVLKAEYGNYFEDYSFRIYARGLNKSAISRICSNFQDDQIVSGTPMAVWGTNGYLMIGLRDSSFKTGGAGKLMGYRIKDTLSIEFRDKENR